MFLSGYWINLITELCCVLQLAVFYPNRGEYGTHQQSINRTGLPQVTSGKLSLFCHCLFNWTSFIAAKFNFVFVEMILKVHLFLEVSKDCVWQNYTHTWCTPFHFYFNLPEISTLAFVCSQIDVHRICETL